MKLGRRVGGGYSGHKNSSRWNVLHMVGVSSKDIELVFLIAGHCFTPPDGVFENGGKGVRREVGIVDCTDTRQYLCWEVTVK
jgi:hypothetical protein